MNWSTYKELLFLSDFNETLVFSTNFRKNLQIRNFTKISFVGTELFQAYGRSDIHDEANSNFFC